MDSIVYGGLESFAIGSEWMAGIVIAEFLLG